MDKEPERLVKSFTPTVLERDDFAVYKPEFEKVFTSEKITNIAVSGPFGAGKTSVVNTWEASKEGSAHKCLHLSLANFRGADRFSSRGDVVEKAAEDIEKMLLNQLVHKVDFWRVPKSRFKTTNGGWRGAAIPVVTAVVLIALLTLGVAELDWYRARMTAGIETGHLPLLMPWLLPIAAFVALFAIRSPFKGLIKRISLGGNEVELFDEESSAFNRYMDDILYLLNSSGYDVVVIEDLDRFERLDVFEGLREINNLLNSKRGKQKRKPVRFFYLVRDDMFTSSDRTKFFDLIIPVIPFVDKSNAADILAPELRKAGVKIDPSFVNELSLYLNDPRVLDDVVNNSGHVKAALFDRSGEKLKDGDAERIVAMSVYKALFPTDYADLQVGRGCVKHYLDKRNEAAGSRRAEINREIDELQGKIEAIEAQGKYNADELALLYMTDKYSEIEESMSAYVHRPSLKGMSPERRIETIRGDKGMGPKFDELICSLVEDSPTFASRYEEALSAPQRQSQVLSERISTLRAESVELSRMSLPELLASLNEEGRNDFFALPTKKTCPARQKEAFGRIVQARKSGNFGLIEYLLCSGYVNESYERYMSNFYPTSVSSSDREVLRQIVQHSATDPLYEFDRPSASARKLSTERFAQKNARILSLCHELLASDDLAEKRARFFEAVLEDRDYRFVFSYAASSFGDAETLPSLESALPDALATSINMFSSETRDARRICQKLLVENPELLSEESLKSSVGRFASTDTGFLHPEISIESSMGEQLKMIGYSAEDLDIEGSHWKTLADVYSLGLYEPDAALMLKLVKSQQPGQEDLKGPQLSNALAAHTEWPSRKKVVAHPVEYLQSAIREFSALEDSEATVAWLVNEPRVLKAGELVSSYASALKGIPIHNASVIEDGAAVETLALAGKVARTGKNILAIYAANDNNVTESVARLVNQGDVPSDLTIEEEVDIIEDADFLIDLAKSKSVSDSAFADVALEYGAVYEALAVEDLPADRAESLARTSSVSMTPENLSLYSRCYPSAVTELARSDVSHYVELVFDEDEPECIFDEGVALTLLRDGSESPSLVRLVEGFGGPQRINLDCYSDVVNAAIIECCFDVEDLGVLGEAYEHSSSSVLKDAVVRKCVEYLDSIICTEAVLPIELRLKLLSNANIGEHCKEQLVSIGCGTYSSEEYSKMFSAAKMDGYFSALTKKGSYLVDESEAAKVILEDLKRMKLISSFKSDGEGHCKVNAKRKKGCQ